MEYFEAVAATYQLQALKDRIETENKLRLYDESVKSIFQAIGNLAKSAISLILKILMGIKTVIFGIFGFIFKKVKDKLKGDHVDIYSGGGGSDYSSVNIGRVGRQPEIIRAANLKLMTLRAKEAIRKYGGLRDGEATLRIRKRLDNIIKNEEGKPLTDEMINDISREAVKDIRVDIDKTSNGVFVISKDIANLVLDVVRGNIAEDKAFDGTKYSDILRQYPFEDFEDIDTYFEKIEKIQALSKNGKYYIADFMSDTLINADSLMLVAMIYQTTPNAIMTIKRIKINTDGNANRKPTDAELTQLQKEINTGYSTVCEGLSEKTATEYTNIILAIDDKLKNSPDVAKLESRIINETKGKVQNIPILDDKTLSTLVSILQDVKFVRNSNLAEIKNTLVFSEFRKLSDNEKTVYAIARSAMINSETRIAAKLMKVIDDNKIELNDLSKSINALHSKGKEIRDKLNEFQSDETLQFDEYSTKIALENILNRSINITLVVSKIVDISQKFIRNVNNPFYKKIQEDISTVVQALYYISAKSDDDK